MPYQIPFEFPHLDPSDDPAEELVEAFELFMELWAKLGSFRAKHQSDRVLTALIDHQRRQLEIGGLLLSLESDLRNDKPDRVSRKEPLHAPSK
ncbi:hypothetical protein [Bradyrhizobium sp. DASA03120]|uniref:hypothetical protein n=1 Tax=Bradyrhizobium sp. SMVTL-02 TaxID=3395917 RepID=UPI003F6FAE70